MRDLFKGVPQFPVEGIPDSIGSGKSWRFYLPTLGGMAAGAALGPFWHHGVFPCLLSALIVLVGLMTGITWHVRNG